MSDQDLKSISGATGSHAALRYPALNGPAERVQTTGKARPQTGNDVPVPERPQPDLEALAAELNISSQSIGRDLRFKVDMASGQSVIQVLDRETGEIIREIPPENATIRMTDTGDMELRLYDRTV